MNEVQRQQYRGNEAALAWRAEVGTLEVTTVRPASNGGRVDYGVVHPGSSGSLGGVWSIRVGSAGIFGDIERADRGFAENLAHPGKLSAYKPWWRR